MKHNTIFLFLTLVVLGCTGNKEEQAQIKLTEVDVTERIAAAWLGQTIGVTFGGPTEFKYMGCTISDTALIPWSDTTLYSNLKNGGHGLYDDIYIDFTFLEVLEKYGISAPADSFALAFARAEYPLWHANQRARYNIIRNKLLPPQSGYWLNNPYADDIDFQIEADFIGLANPGMPLSTIELADKVGHIMNSGDGYYGGLFTALLHSYAFIETDIEKLIERTMAHIPDSSQFEKCINTAIEGYKLHPTDWRKTWQMLEDKWGQEVGAPRGVFHEFNIDAKINAAYIVLGLLYGQGDFEKTLQISTRAGQDSDCNPASACSVLGALKGMKAIPDKYKVGYDKIKAIDFINTTVSLDDATRICLALAKDYTQKMGGSVADGIFALPNTRDTVVALEQNFINHFPSVKILIDSTQLQKDGDTLSIAFEGTGLVFTGRCLKYNANNMYKRPDTLADSVTHFKFYMDGKLVADHYESVNKNWRSFSPFAIYNLPMGNHQFKIELVHMPHKVRFSNEHIVVYHPNPINWQKRKPVSLVDYFQGKMVPDSVKSQVFIEN